MIDWGLIDDWLMIYWWLNDDWFMIDWWFIDDWLLIDWWLMIDWWLIDDLLVDDWLMIDWWLIDDWLLIIGMALSQFWLCLVFLWHYLIIVYLTWFNLIHIYCSFKHVGLPACRRQPSTVLTPGDFHRCYTAHIPCRGGHKYNSHCTRWHRPGALDPGEVY